MIGTQMARIAQMQQCPHLGISHHHNIASLSTISSVRSSESNVFFPSEMNGAASPIA
jgi:hypothetical protein